MQKYYGFSLIELIVAVIIFSIIASIAIPNYKRYLLKSRRLEGQTNLLKIQAAYEAYFTQNNTYPTANTLPPLPNIPSTTYYSYTSATTATTYTITANATGNQASDQEGPTSCAAMSTDYRGIQTPSACWPQ